MYQQEADIKQTIAEASRAVAEAEIEEPLRERAFDRVLEFLLRTQSSKESPDVESTKRAPQEAPGEGPITRIAERAGIGVEHVKQVYRIEGDKLAVVVANGKIAASKSSGARELTLLVAGGRQAGGIEEWTPLSHARDICERYKRFDAANYAATIKRMDSEFSIHGSAASKELRLTMPGWEAWADLLKKITASGE